MSNEITVRDYFAAKAMQALISGGEGATWNKTGGVRRTEQQAICQAAYEFADEMMFRRGCR